MSRHSKYQISIIRFRTQATNSSTTANYANVAYNSLTYNMPSATLTIESKANEVIFILSQCSTLVRTLL